MERSAPRRPAPLSPSTRKDPGEAEPNPSFPSPTCRRRQFFLLSQIPSNPSLNFCFLSRCLNSLTKQPWPEVEARTAAKQVDVEAFRGQELNRGSILYLSVPTNCPEKHQDATAVLDITTPPSLSPSSPSVHRAYPFAIDHRGVSTPFPD